MMPFNRNMILYTFIIIISICSPDVAWPVSDARDNVGGRPGNRDNEQNEQNGNSEGGLTLQHIQEAYKVKKDGYTVCAYDGSLCNLREEIYSAILETCYDGIFWGLVTEQEKDTFCEDIVKGKKQVNIEGAIDVCYYRLGYRTSLILNCVNCTSVTDETSGNNAIKAPNDNVAKELESLSSKEEQFISNYTAGTEYCPFDQSFCHRDREVCSPDTESCMQVVPGGLSAPTTRQFCENVITSKTESVVGLRDVCIYYIGTQIAAEKIYLEKYAQNFAHVIVIITVLIILLVIISFIAVMVYCIRKRQNQDRPCASGEREYENPRSRGKRQILKESMRSWLLCYKGRSRSKQNGIEGGEKYQKMIACEKVKRGNLYFNENREGAHGRKTEVTSHRQSNNMETYVNSQITGYNGHSRTAAMNSDVAWHHSDEYSRLTPVTINFADADNGHNWQHIKAYNMVIYHPKGDPAT